MSECILFYTKLHSEWSLAPSGRERGGGEVGRGSPSYDLYGDMPLAGFYGF